MANLRLPTLKTLEKLGGNDAFEWLAMLERELNTALVYTPESDIRTRRNLQKRLDRLQERREEYKASLHP